MTSIPRARRLAIAGALLLCLCNISQALPVFPGAVGYGSQTIAGRNAAAADIYEVTTLADDSYTSPSVGTLRYGIEKIARPRVIVFRVSGVIELRRDLMVRMNDAAGDHGYLTIAGQTAPYPGITLKNGGIRVMSHDVLIQHIAVRPGNIENTSSGWDLTTLDNRDCIRVETSGTAIANNIVIDHISCSWSTDDAVSMWSETGTVSNVTFSNSMLGDPIQFAGHEKRPTRLWPARRRGHFERDAGAQCDGVQLVAQSADPRPDLRRTSGEQLHLPPRAIAQCRHACGLIRRSGRPQ